MNTSVTPELIVGSPEWLHERRSYLGASEIAAVMGLSPWSTPVELWMDKIGTRPARKFDPARLQVLERGRKLEQTIVDMSLAKLRSMGLEVELVARNQRYADPVYPFLRCEIDFEIRVTGTIYVNGIEMVLHDELINADAKSVGSPFARKKWGDEETEDIPIEYAAQFAAGLMVTPGMRRLCAVCALMSFEDVGIYWLLRDEETITGIRAKAVQFWTEHVLTGIPPDPMVFSDIKALFPLDNGQAVEATDEIREKVLQLDQIKAQIKTWKESEEELTFEISEYISPHARLTYGGKDIATWKGQPYAGFREREFKTDHPDLAEEYTDRRTIRVLRLKKGTK